jgi:3-oxoacyl-[acyl-carrier-protein] synthase II
MLDPFVAMPGNIQIDPLRRVVVTGAGVVTALGLDWAANAAGFRAGVPAFRPVTRFDVSRQRTKLAAEVDLPPTFPTGQLNARAAQRLDRAAVLLLLAAQAAWTQCGWSPSGDLPFIVSTTSAGMASGEAYYRQATAHPGRHRGQATRLRQYQPHRPAEQVLAALGCDGPIQILANACASGSNALGHAWQWIHWGLADRVLTGGFDALSPMVFAGFDALQALSPTRCRPFDARRDGLLLGEGAAVFAIETLDSARRRGGEILGEIVGYGASTDLHHLTQPQPDGDAALAAMNAACRRAGLRPDQIGYLNAHGTGTPLNDAAEARAILRWAGTQAASRRVSSTKSVIGHLLGAAGAVEAAVCLMALRGGWLPPNATTDTPDPACSFDLVREPRDADFEFALSNSFGFGGANATLILRRFP